MLRIGSLRACGQCVLEVVRVLAAGDDDAHGSCDASEPSRARSEHHGDGELQLSRVYCAGVLEGEGAAVAAEGSGDVLDGHVTGIGGWPTLPQLTFKTRRVPRPRFAWAGPLTPR